MRDKAKPKPVTAIRVSPLQTHEHDRRIYNPGETFILPRDQASSLIQLGIVEPIETLHEENDHGSEPD